VNDLAHKTELALGVRLPARQGKPRTRGLTMMIDWGLPCGHQADVAATGGAFIDMAKIAARYCHENL
jgi:phosphosulfolactate synthase (CoM biosynthesis protein A)